MAAGRTAATAAAMAAADTMDSAAMGAVWGAVLVVGVDHAVGACLAALVTVGTVAVRREMVASEEVGLEAAVLVVAGTALVVAMVGLLEAESEAVVAQAVAE